MSGQIAPLDTGDALTEVDGRLAWEIASQISDVPTLMARYKMTAEQFKKKLGNPVFRSAVKEAKALWSSDMSSDKRIQIKSSLLVEDSLLVIYKIVQDEQSPHNARLEAFEKLVRVANLTPKSKDTSGPANPGFRVNIIMGPGPNDKVTIDGQSLESPSSAE